MPASFYNYEYFFSFINQSVLDISTLFKLFIFIVVIDISYRETNLLWNNLLWNIYRNKLYVIAVFFSYRETKIKLFYCFYMFIFYKWFWYDFVSLILLTTPSTYEKRDWDGCCIKCDDARDDGKNESIG